MSVWQEVTVPGASHHGSCVSHWQGHIIDFTPSHQPPLCQGGERVACPNCVVRCQSLLWPSVATEFVHSRSQFMSGIHVADKIRCLYFSLPLTNSFINLFTSALEIACLNAFSSADCSHSDGSTVWTLHSTAIVYVYRKKRLSLTQNWSWNCGWLYFCQLLICLQSRTFCSSKAKSNTGWKKKNSTLWYFIHRVLETGP